MTRDQHSFESVEEAWKQFRSTLADQLASTEEWNHILWELDGPERAEDRTTPYIQVTWIEPDDGGPFAVTAEVSSNKVLHPRYRTNRSALARLRDAGWRAPEPGRLNYWRQVDPAYVDEAAWLLVDALRTTFGVVHPAFLIDGFGEACALADAEAAELLAEQVTDPGECLPEVITPQDRDHLVELVDRALGSDWSRPTPTHDEDGDIPYICDSAVVFVRVLPHAPIVRAFCELVLGATDLEAAAFEVGVLNREHSGVKFTLHDDVVRMSMELQALPLVPYHLRVMVTTMCELAPNLDSVLARRIGGHRFAEPSEGDAA